MAAQLRVFHSSGSGMAGVLQHHILGIWNGPPSQVHLAAYRQALRRLYQEAEPWGAMAVIRTASIDGLDMSDKVREELSGLVAETRGRKSSLALVVESEGFLAAGVRALTQSILMLSRVTYPMRFFPSRGEAAWWLHEQTHLAGREPVAASVLTSAVGELLAHPPLIGITSAFEPAGTSPSTQPPRGEPASSKDSTRRGR